jgi:hypothetical protein
MRIDFPDAEIDERGRDERDAVERSDGAGGSGVSSDDDDEGRGEVQKREKGMFTVLGG